MSIFKTVKKKHLFILFCIFLFSGIFFSCSDSVPIVEDVYFTHFEKSNSQLERMAVFVKLESDVKNIETITVKDNSSGKVWIIDNPEIIQDKGNQKYYCGSSNLVPERNSTFTGGEYTVIYTDRAGRDTETHFFYIKDKNKE